MNRIISLLSRHRSKWLLLLLFTILPLLSSSVFLLLVVQHQAGLAALDWPVWFLLFSILSVPIALSLLPNTLAGLLAGYFLGWAGLAGMTLSFSLACIWGYFLGRLAGGSRLTDDLIRIWPKLGTHISAFREKPYSLVSGLRLLPAPPFAMGSLLLSWLEIPFRTYILGSLAGMLPRMALVVFAGSLARNLEELLRNGIFDYRIYACFILLALAGFLLIFRYFRRKKNSLNDNTIQSSDLPDL